jgi:osmotically-inducible protein OsmY
MHHKETRDGVATQGKRQISTLQKFADGRIQEACGEAIYRCQDCDSTDVVISVEDGVVNLSGAVHDKQAREIVVRCLRNIPDLRSIENELKIIPLDKMKLS